MIFVYSSSGVYKAQLPEFIPNARDWYSKTKLEKIDDQNGYLTSLSDYSVAESDSDKIKSLESALPFVEDIEKHGEEFLRQMGYGLIRPLKVKNIWLNEIRSGEESLTHSHFGHVLSGTFYVDMPAGCSGITFESPLAHQHRAFIPIQEYTQFNGSNWTAFPEPGDILMWLSYTPHRVERSEFEGVRRSVAFDLGF